VILRNRWLRVSVGVLAAIALLYGTREQLERALVAYGTYHARVFTSPPREPGESWWHEHFDHVQFYWDLSRLHVEREKRLKLLNPELKPLVQEIRRRQMAGQGMQYSMHIYREIRWRLNFTPDVATTRIRIADLRQSRLQQNEQKLAADQQSSDGSWGMGINVWYLKLYYSVENGIDTADVQIKYPLAFLDRINSPEKLNTELNAALYDRFTGTGVFNREELDETFSAVARLLFKTKPIPYEFDPRLRDALRVFVRRWQNPATGCWGQWMVDREGRVWKMDDMAMTFHVVSDLKGQVDHLDLIAKRLLELDHANFPAGIRFDGHYENHLNWDAVKIFRLAWPHLDEPTRQQARAEISRMLNWCLSKSYQPDGSFKVSEMDDTAGDAYSYGVYFLREAGYFRREDRFWTDQDFPEAAAIRERIVGKLKSTGLTDPDMRNAYEVLEEVRIPIPHGALAQ